MTETKRDKLWTAYMDGELSSSEASEFDESLTSEERGRLAAEMRLESALADALRQDVKCPEALWRRTQMQLRNQDRPRKARRFMVRGAVALTALAAAIAIMVVLPGGGEGPLAIHAATVEEFAAQSAVPPDVAAVQRYLKEHDIHLDLALDGRIQAGHHQGHLLGACEGNCPEGTLLEIMFNCCGHPVKLAIAPRGTGGARMIERAAAKHQVQAVAEVGDYVAAVIGKHQAPELIGLIQDATPHIT